MKKKDQKTLTQIIGLGIISGMRATFASAVMSHYLSKEHNVALSKSKLGFMQSPVTATVTKLLSTGEIVGDKLPNIPNRIGAPPLMARVAAGAFAGAVICTANKDSIAKGIFIGGATALAATFGAYYLRKYVSENTFIKEPATGSVEDSIAIGTGALLMR